MFLFVFYAVIIWSTFWHYPKYFPKISCFPSNISILQISVTSAYISTKMFFLLLLASFALLVKLLLAVQLYFGLSPNLHTPVMCGLWTHQYLWIVHSFFDLEFRFVCDNTVTVQHGVWQWIRTQKYISHSAMSAVEFQKPVVKKKF